MGAASRSFRFKSSVKPLQRNGRRAKLRCKHRRLTALVPRIFRRDYGARGETLPGGFDNVPGGMSYGFVGGLGVRTDADTGLRYMRQRWYDPTLQRFISRDQLHSQNRYDYAAGSPTVLVDVTGLEPATPTGGTHLGGGIYQYGPHSYHNNGEGYPGSAALEAAIATIRAKKLDCPKRDKNAENQVVSSSDASEIADWITRLARDAMGAAAQHLPILRIVASGNASEIADWTTRLARDAIGAALQHLPILPIPEAPPDPAPDARPQPTPSPRREPSIEDYLTEEERERLIRARHLNRADKIRWSQKKEKYNNPGGGYPWWYPEYLK